MNDNNKNNNQDKNVGKRSKDTSNDNGNFENKILELEEKIMELDNNWKRALADYKNLEKRVAEEKNSFSKILKADLVGQLIPLLDNLVMLDEHANDEGISLVTKSFINTLNNLGVTEIDPQDKFFDIKEMEAIEVVDGKKDFVVEVTQKGYKLDNIVLRPAKVKVGNGEKPKKEGAK